LCVSWILSLLVCSACQRDILTEFPDGLEPLDTCAAAWPDGEYPEMVGFWEEVGDPDQGCVVGWVQAPLAVTWAAIQRADAVVDRRAVDAWTVEEDVEPEYDVSVLIHNVVNDIVTVEFDVTWRQGRVDGTDDEPVVVAARWQKTEGTSFISLLEGSLVATQVDGEDVTSIEMFERIEGAASDTQEIDAYLHDLHASIVALVHDGELPAYDDE
jgi:hypothetical protein